MEKVLEEEIALWRRVAEYYLCTVGEVYKAAYPANKINLEEARAQAREKAVQRRGKLVVNIRKRLQTLQDRIQNKQAQLEKSQKAAEQRAQKAAEQRAQKTKTALKLEAEIAKIAEDIAKTEAALKTAQKNAQAAKEGLSLNETALPDCKVRLTDAQQKAYSKITEGFAVKKPVMLHGVTGSGKTEIYIKAAHEGKVVHRVGEQFSVY